MKVPLALGSTCSMIPLNTSGVGIRIMGFGEGDWNAG